MRFARKHAAFNDVIEIALRGGGKLTRDGTVVSVLDFPADMVFFYIHHIGGLFIKVGTLYNLAVEAENGSGAGAEFAAENTEFAIVHISDGKVPAVRLVSILRCLRRLIGNGAGHGGRFVFLILDSLPTPSPLLQAVRTETDIMSAISAQTHFFMVFYLTFYLYLQLYNVITCLSTEKYFLTKIRHITRRN